ncbi:hypothetical protein B9Z65_2901 [Elsinoe australis]|uniref:Uncharacterized protein n=1 Tax=Elsinoe australis TaxID=40998 RepID=A0A2P7ZTV9_9PEZI|nr:hypothetical protein B9Z65_2901 [Elsinoe australis]
MAVSTTTWSFSNYTTPTSTCGPCTWLVVGPAYGLWTTDNAIPPLATTHITVVEDSNITKTSIECNRAVFSSYWTPYPTNGPYGYGLNNGTCGLEARILKVADKGQTGFPTGTVTAPYNYLDLGINLIVNGGVTTTVPGGSTSCVSNQAIALTTRPPLYSGRIFPTNVTLTGNFGGGRTLSTQLVFKLPELTDYYPDQAAVEQCTLVKFDAVPNTLTNANYLTVTTTVSSIMFQPILQPSAVVEPTEAPQPTRQPRPGTAQLPHANPATPGSPDITKLLPQITAILGNGGDDSTGTGDRGQGEVGGSAGGSGSSGSGNSGRGGSAGNGGGSGGSFSGGSGGEGNGNDGNSGAGTGAGSGGNGASNGGSGSGSEVGQSGGSGGNKGSSIGDIIGGAIGGIIAGSFGGSNGAGNSGSGGNGGSGGSASGNSGWSGGSGNTIGSGSSGGSGNSVGSGSGSGSSGNGGYNAGGNAAAAVVVNPAGEADDGQGSSDSGTINNGVVVGGFSSSGSSGTGSSGTSSQSGPNRAVRPNTAPLTTQPAVYINNQLVISGGAPITVNGKTLTLDASGTTVTWGGSTIPIAQLAPAIGPSATVSSTSLLVYNGQTLLPGGSPVTVVSNGVTQVLSMAAPTAPGASPSLVVLSQSGRSSNDVAKLIMLGLEIAGGSTESDSQKDDDLDPLAAGWLVSAALESMSAKSKAAKAASTSTIGSPNAEPTGESQQGGASASASSTGGPGPEGIASQARAPLATGILFVSFIAALVFM